jgi:hypothetical protein
MEQLSSGVLLAATTEDSFAVAPGQPIRLQVLGVQPIVSKDPNASRRVKITVSDGVYKGTALLATQLASLPIAEGAIIDVSELVGNRKLAATSTGGAVASNKR